MVIHNTVSFSMDNMSTELAETQFPAKKRRSMEDSQTSDVYFTEDIITEILLRLPFKALFRNKCISKQWKSIISDVNFRRSYMKRTSKYSTHVWGYLPRSIDNNNYNIPTTTTDLNLSNEEPPPLYLPNSVRVLASSNGLLLIEFGDDRPIRQISHKLCVCNPLTKQSYALPLRPVSLAASSFGLATRTDHNWTAAAYVSYKVVFIRKIRRDCCAISIYSSDTGRWTRSADEHKVRSCPEIVFGWYPSTHCNGVLHWFDFKNKTLVTYDPYDSPDRFSSIDLPSVGPSRQVGVRVFHLCQPDSVVKFGEIEEGGDGDRKLIVWQLFNGECQWWIERTCLISPTWCVPTDSWRSSSRRVYRGRDYFCCLGVDEEDHVDRCDIIDDVQPHSWESNVPIALCPWASPCCGSQTTSLVGLRKVSPVWFSQRQEASSVGKQKQVS